MLAVTFFYFFCCLLKNVSYTCKVEAIKIAFFIKNFYNMNEGKKYKTVKDYAKDNGISTKTVYNRIESGKLKSKKVLNTTLIEI